MSAPSPPTAATSPRNQDRPPRVNTATRLALLQAAILAVILAAVVLSLVRTFSSQSSSTTTHLLTAEVSGFHKAADSRPPGTDLVHFSHTYLRTHPLPDGEQIVIGFPGRSALGSAQSGPLISSPEISAILVAPPARSIEQTVVVGRTTYRMLAVPVDAGASRATFIVAASQTQVHQNESRVLRLALIEALIALAAGGFAGYLLLRGLLRRIGRVTDTAAGLGRGEMERRLADQDNNDEVGQLAATFDAMADRVAAAMAAQRELLADVSHQLRTPLTVARGHLEVLQRTAPDPDDVRETIGLVIDELEHMTAQVEGLLMLGHALEPDFVSPQPVDLRSLVTDVFESGQVLADREWTLEPIPDLTLTANLDKLRGAIFNLIDNAVKATVDGDQILVAATVRDDGWLALSVSDSGPGIPLAERQAVLDRFSRPGANESRGTGLGLAIVSAVADGHGGRVEISDSQLGGAAVAIVLPPTIYSAGGEA
jgi:signal transduction histidine kinase